MFSVLSHLGITTSYSTLIRKGVTASEREALHNPEVTTPSPESGSSGESDSDPGNLPLESPNTGLKPNSYSKKSPLVSILHTLSQSARNAARTLAATGLFGSTYDNINFLAHIATQLIGRTGEYMYIFEFVHLLEITLRFPGKRYNLHYISTLQGKN